MYAELLKVIENPASDRRSIKVIFARGRQLCWLGMLLVFILWLNSVPVQAAPRAASVTIDLCASDGTLTLPNTTVPIWAFVDTGGGPCTPGLATSLPGPTIQVNAGDEVTLHLTNALGVPTSILIPGQTLLATGGVPGTFTAEASATGGTAIYSFVAMTGTYLYESGTDPATQVAMGLYGALIVNSATPGQAYNQPSSAFDSEIVLVLSEIDPMLNANPTAFNMLDYRPTYWLINGTAYPDTPDVQANPGSNVLLRYLNAGYLHHSMALLGTHQQVVAKNSFELANPFRAIAEIVPAGQTLDSVAEIPAGAPAGTNISLYNRNAYLTNGGLGALHTPGGMQMRFVVGSSAPPPTATPTPTDTPIPPTSTPTPTNTPVPPTSTPTPTATDTPIPPTSTPTPTNTPVPPTSTPTPTATNTPLLPTNTPTPTNTPNSAIIFVSSSSAGSVGSPTVSFQDEDILAYSQAGNSWSMVFDLSDVGITTDVDAFAFRNGGASVLLSFDAPLTVPGVGSVDDSDIVEFVPTSIGSTTAGSFAMYFDGSDVGLSAASEDIDALHQLPDGRLLISTLGAFIVPGASGNDEDLLLFTPTSLGANTTGSWTIYFDGSNVGLTNSSEDLWGVWEDSANGQIYLSTVGNYSVPGGVSGDNDDIFVCTPGSLGSNATTCSFSLFWDGDLFGFGAEQIDGIAINDGPVLVTTSAALSQAGDDEASGDDQEVQEDIDDSEQTNPSIFVPMIRR